MAERRPNPHAGQAHAAFSIYPPDSELLTINFEVFQAKVMALLSELSTVQAEKIHLINNEIMAMRGQISQLTAKTSELVREQNKHTQILVNIDQFKLLVNQKIERISKDIGRMKKELARSKYATPAASHNMMLYEDMIFEIQERSRREKNIIICGIPEITSEVAVERLVHDKQEVKRILRLAYPGCPEPTKVMRIGQYCNDKRRPIKACLLSADAVKIVLRNITKITEAEANIKCFADQTPDQRKIMKEAQEELKTRTEAGEQNLIIKYIKGIPKVVKAPVNNDQA